MGGFLHPALLWGTALFMVPILIHLLNRRRYQRVPWAAMSFLMKAHKTNRRRLRMENLLLLLVRCLIVILLALAVTRPYLSADTPLPVSTEKRKDNIIVLDQSYSMGYQESGERPLQRGVQEGLRVLEGLKTERGDRATLIVSKNIPRVASWRDPAKAREELRFLEEPSFEGNNFRATLGWVRKAVEDFGEGGEIIVHWISDLQRASFSTAETSKEKSKDLDSILTELADRNVRINFVDVGPSSMKPSNLGLVALSHDELEPNFAGSTMMMRARVRNHGGSDRNGARVKLFVDGSLQTTETIDIPAGQEREVAFTATLQEAGSHWIRAAVDGDALAADDERAHTFWVRPPLKILMVDNGLANADLDLLDCGPLLRLFSPEEASAAGDAKPFFLPTRIDRSQYFASPEIIYNYDLVILANLEGFPEGGIEKLENFVSSGKALFIAVGEQVDPAYYNAKLRAGKKENYLLPAMLTERHSVASRRTEYYRVTVQDATHPVLQFFRDEKWRPYLTEVPVYEFFKSIPDPADTATRVIASLDDVDKSPILIEKTVGKGKVALWTSTLNAKWNKIPDSLKTFYPLMLDLFLFLSTGENRERDLAIGDPIHLETSRFPRRMSWTDAKGTQRSIEEAPKNLGPDRFLVPEIAQTERPGVYSIEVETASGASGMQIETTRFAVNVDPSEGNLERIPPESVSSYFPGLRVNQSSSLSDGNAATPADPKKDKGEVWKNIVWAGLAFLVLESLLAAWFGRRRKVS